MARRLRTVELDFVESAPLRLAFSTEVTASPQAVYRALAEDVEGWACWFDAVTKATPTGEGAGRDIKLKGGALFVETILATEPDERFAYRVDETNVPGLRALLEEWRLSPTAKGTRVQWTFAADAPAPMRVMLRLGRAGLGASFRGAVRSLDRRLARSAAQ
ncbi:SRPBCC family protein [Streptomyces lunaelactis]|uniref:SRPBCC family protein n=1 Tax=Streptomyces lunaelactis TaxID=1535768 RepID=UPI0015851149|nr:SRPBCC family protein [Streptomyces lunaelactis]NUK00385.1 SRPBCC family protein [Streptomyces lunaelactis]NUK14193.1 SRPBCC family protein [Streptomyces lunaelactis]NUK21800.1 SRPBCC family protein [Streptomyces lunaelactis]NUK33441.1 SRPBCC family protein [Streptomyces lunaelactis]NUK40019.1 SRPBCC family protein [Streptomyces lunaelactis]